MHNAEYEILPGNALSQNRANQGDLMQYKFMLPTMTTTEKVIIVSSASKTTEGINPIRKTGLTKICSMHATSLNVNLGKFLAVSYRVAPRIIEMSRNRQNDARFGVLYTSLGPQNADEFATAQKHDARSSHKHRLK